MVTEDGPTKRAIILQSLIASWSFDDQALAGRIHHGKRPCVPMLDKLPTLLKWQRLEGRGIKGIPAAQVVSHGNEHIELEAFGGGRCLGEMKVEPRTLCL